MDVSLFYLFVVMVVELWCGVDLICYCGDYS